jgi:LmbE family N-acetylglucosaminyl deacetylase
MVKTILGIGAHYDDCVFGIPGIMLNAVRKNHRVVILTLIGDYSNWQTAAGRERELVEGAASICEEHGVEMRFLDFTGLRFDVSEVNQQAVAEAVAEIEPDVAFMLWPHDHHPDHEVASRLSKIALGQGGRIVPPGRRFRRPRHIYMYDNGPRHTIGFEPDTFVDVTDQWPRAIDWLGQFMAMVRGEPHDPAQHHAAQRAKEALALYRGQTCGVRYAEAVRAAHAYPQELF